MLFIDQKEKIKLLKPLQLIAYVVIKGLCSYCVALTLSLNKMLQFFKQKINTFTRGKRRQITYTVHIINNAWYALKQLHFYIKKPHHKPRAPYVKT